MDRKSVAAVVVALLVPVGALVWVATGITVGPDDAADRQSDETASGAELLCSATGVTPEELAAANAATDALAEHLLAHGIEHQTWITNGRHYVDWDRQDTSAQAAVDAFQDAAAGEEPSSLSLDVADDRRC